MGDNLEYVLKPSRFFLKQLDKLTSKSKRILEKKFKLIKQNPHRYKRVKGFNYLLFRVRFENNRKEKRVIYEVDGSHILIHCILDRDKDYKGLKNYLKNHI